MKQYIINTQRVASLYASSVKSRAVAGKIHSHPSIHQCIYNIQVGSNNNRHTQSTEARTLAGWRRICGNSHGISS